MSGCGNRFHAASRIFEPFRISPSEKRTRGNHGSRHQIGCQLVCLQCQRLCLRMINISDCHRLGGQKRSAFFLHHILAMGECLFACIDKLQRRIPVALGTKLAHHG